MNTMTICTRLDIGSPGEVKLGVGYTSEEYIKVIIVHPKVHFFFVYVMYLNIACYLYGKQITSKFGNKLYL